MFYFVVESRLKGPIEESKQLLNNHLIINQGFKFRETLAKL